MCLWIYQKDFFFITHLTCRLLLCTTSVLSLYLPLGGGPSLLSSSTCSSSTRRSEVVFVVEKSASYVGAGKDTEYWGSGDSPSDHQTVCHLTWFISWLLSLICPSPLTWPLIWPIPPGGGPHLAGDLPPPTRRETTWTSRPSPWRSRPKRRPSPDLRLLLRL